MHINIIQTYMHKRISEDMFVITRPQTSIVKNTLRPQHAQASASAPYSEILTKLSIIRNT